MKKPIEKRKIQMTWSKSDFIDRGIQVWAYKTWFIIIPLFTVLFILTVIIDNNIVDKILLSIAMVSVAVWYCFLYIKGKQYWKENKDKQEPIQIERLPDMWGRKRTWDDINEKNN